LETSLELQHKLKEPKNYMEPTRVSRHEKLDKNPHEYKIIPVCMQLTKEIKEKSATFFQLHNLTEQKIIVLLF
jgi:hypothetical protein